MTEDEMRTVVQVTNNADGGCADCAHILASYLIDNFPEFRDVIKQEWEKGFDRPYDLPPKVEPVIPSVFDKPVRFPRRDQ